MEGNKPYGYMRERYWGRNQYLDTWYIYSYWWCAIGSGSYKQTELGSMCQYLWHRDVYIMYICVCVSIYIYIYKVCLINISHSLSFIYPSIYLYTCLKSHDFILIFQSRNTVYSCLFLPLIVIPPQLWES